MLNLFLFKQIQLTDREVFLYPLTLSMDFPYRSLLKRNEQPRNMIFHILDSRVRFSE
jgi:hypothetical protein